MQQCDVRGADVDKHVSEPGDLGRGRVTSQTTLEWERGDAVYRSFVYSLPWLLDWP